MPRSTVRPFSASCASGAAQRFELERPSGLCSSAAARSGSGFRARFFGRAKHAGDFVAALQKRFQHRFTKVLLSDDRNFHLSLLSVTECVTDTAQLRAGY